MAATFGAGTPSPAASVRRHPLAQLLRLTALDALRGVGSWRWLAVPPVFALVAWQEADAIRYQYAPGRDAAAWDIPLSMLLNQTAVLLAVALGFMVLVGDLYVRDREAGYAALTLTRARSRVGWWLAKVGAVGVLALVFVAIGLGTALIVGGLRFGWALGPSDAARPPAGVVADEAAVGALYPRPEGLPVPVFFAVVAAYTALALWPLGVTLLAASLVVPRAFVPLLLAALWVLAGLTVAPVTRIREGVARLDPLGHIVYAVHFDLGLQAGVPWSQSLAVLGGAVGGFALFGAWYLRRCDV